MPPCFVSPLHVLNIHIALDPTKLKACQFGHGSASTRDADSSLWTETPAERQQRLADEVSGRKAANADPKGVDKDPKGGQEVTKTGRGDSERCGGGYSTFLARMLLICVDSRSPLHNSVECVVQHSSMHIWTANLRRKGMRKTNQMLSGIMLGICLLMAG